MHSDLALVSATVARAKPSSTWTVCSFTGSLWKLVLRPSVGNPSLVCATMIVLAVIPAQEVTPLETTSPWEAKAFRQKLVSSPLVLRCESPPGSLGCGDPLLQSSLRQAAFAILWIALRGENVSSMLATSFHEAAGLTGRQKWGLILPSSVRVSQVTYQTVLVSNWLARPGGNFFLNWFDLI